MNIANAVSAVFWGLLLLSILVFVHEAGHYIAARAFGVRVTEFYLGLPCRLRLFKKSKNHGTEFGVTPLLLGGYNRICGMEAEDDNLMAAAFGIVQREGRVEAETLAEELEIDLERAYALLVGLSDYAAIRPYYNPELGEYPMQKDYPQAFEALARDANMLTEYDKGHDFTEEGSTKDGEPRPLHDAEGQLGKERARTYKGLSYPKRLVVLFAGPVVNLVLAFILATGGFMAVEYQTMINVNEIGSVTKGSLAESAGLKSGDKIIRVADTEVSDWVGVSEALAAAREVAADFDVVYERDGKQNTATIDLPDGEPVDLVGVNARTEAVHLTLAESIMSSFEYAKQVGSVAVRLIMPQHTMEVLSQSTSIVGISVMASEAASSSFLDIIALLAAVSMSLGFMNLLPIPPLDGGKILVETIQAISHRPLSTKAQMAVSYVGIAFFVFVFVVVLRNDIMRFIVG